MNLGKNINNLLKRYPEVYVKGLGVFKKKHSPAQFDKQRELFLPPISYVEFDATSDQGFNFIHYIQQQQNLNLEAATEVLKKSIADLNDQLIQQGQAKLEDLGHIVSYGASLVFKPLDISGFNFEPIRHVVTPEIETVIPDREREEVLPFDTETVEEEKLEDNIDEEVVESIDQNLIEEEILVEQDDLIGAEPIDEQKEVIEESPLIQEESIVPDYDEESSRKSNTIWYYISAAIIVIVAVIAAFLLNSDLKDQLFGSKKSNKSEVVVKPIDTLAKVDTTQLLTDSTKVDSLKIDTLVNKPVISVGTTAAVKESLPTAKPNYQLVISGYHKTMQGAEAEAAELRKKGYATVRAVEGKYKRNKKKVIWDSYMTKEEADRDQATVAKTFKGAWVEKLKN